MYSPKVSELQKKLESLDAKLEGVTKRPAGKVNPETPTREEAFGVPFARKGESALTSRGFQFQRLVGVMTKVLQPEEAKVELDVTERLRKAMVIDNKFEMAQGSFALAPLGTDFMGGNGVGEEFRHEMKSLCYAGVANIDRQEMEWIARKTYAAPGRKAQSWIDDTLGGSLVPPAEYGELIQLLRNKDALINAGARVVPLPSSGRLKMPRQTTATQGYWVGENQTITPTSFGTGSLTLSAKKCAALVVIPSELIRFASPASEALLRADMTKTLSLTMDKALLDGPGSDNVPLGLVNTPNVAVVTPTTVAANGNTLSPQDLYAFISAVEANNGEFQGWIMRPELFWYFVEGRGSALASGDQKGPFVFNQFRELGAGFVKNLGGYQAVTTPQVSNQRVKGASSNLTYAVGGQWDDFIIAMFGSIEFAMATQGDTTFANDQVAVRSILTCDGAARHPGVFAVADQLVQGVGA